MVWDQFTRPEISADSSLFSNRDAAILDEESEIRYIRGNLRILRLITIKANTAKGAEKISRIRLPESFDQAHDRGYGQGRRSRIQLPWTNEFMVERFSARRLGKTWKQLKSRESYERVRWIRSSGVFADEDVISFEVMNVRAGDVIQIFYEATFKGQYGNDIYYFYSELPKVKTTFTFVYDVHKADSSFSCLLPIYVPDSLQSRTAEERGDRLLINHKFTLRNVETVNYPANAFEGRKLPHVYLDFSSIILPVVAYQHSGRRGHDLYALRPRNFEWMFFIDTVTSYTKIYDKHFGAIRKFVAALPALKADSSRPFFKALCDTFNAYRFVTENHAYYNDNIYEFGIEDHLKQRRLLGAPFTLTRDILNDNGMYYYIANIQDKRYGEHSMFYRAHYGYEYTLFALPEGNSFIYFMPRTGGVQYCLNELPYYLEGSLAALRPQNLQATDTSKSRRTFRFIRTHQGTAEGNSRAENASVMISGNSATFNCKEILSGQFSTILRHHYRSTYIDSSITQRYFRKCTDKPSMRSAKIALSSRSSDYPYRHTFNCSGTLELKEKNAINLSGWFSFILSGTAITEKPHHDYFFDFIHTDLYNFQLKFDKPVTITNAAAFKRSVDNEYFKLEADISAAGENAYLVTARFTLKKAMIPLQEMDQLVTMVKELDALNSFVLNYQ